MDTWHPQRMQHFPGRNNNKCDIKHHYVYILLLDTATNIILVYVR